MTTSASPLIFGYSVSDNGEISPISWGDVSKGPVQQPGKRVWVHLNRLAPEARAWLAGTGGIDRIALDALFQEETRPRAIIHGDGWLINLRGVNLNDGKQEDFMIALRIYVTESVLITTRAFKIRAAEDMDARFVDGNPPASNADAVIFLADRLIARMEPIVETLSDKVDELEETFMDGTNKFFKSDLARARKQAISMRRFLLPQKEALAELSDDQGPVFSNAHHRSFRETSNNLQRLSEELEAVRDRSQIVQEMLIEQRSEAMNQRLFVLAIISAIFLPLGFVTGLFGVNVGGIPGTTSPWAFAILCIALVGMGGGLYWLFRKLGWMD